MIAILDYHSMQGRHFRFLDYSFEDKKKDQGAKIFFGDRRISLPPPPSPPKQNLK